MHKMSKHSSDSGVTPETAPMEQVRELLFGAQLKDMDTRLLRQEEHFKHEISDIKNSFRKRLDSLENFMKSEASSALSRLKEEQREREESMKIEQRERIEALRNEQRERAESATQLSKDIATIVETFERKLAHVSGTLDSTERELRQLLLSESGSLADKIESKYDAALSVLSKTAAQIRSDMVYRTSLSSMLTEMVVKLSGSLSISVLPDEEETFISPENSLEENHEQG